LRSSSYTPAFFFQKVYLPRYNFFFFDSSLSVSASLHEIRSLLDCVLKQMLEVSPIQTSVPTATQPADPPDKISELKYSRKPTSQPPSFTLVDKTYFLNTVFFFRFPNYWTARIPTPPFRVLDVSRWRSYSSVRDAPFPRNGVAFPKRNLFLK